MADALSLEAVSLSYGTHKILDGIDLELPLGKVSVLAGPNGCGKSTVLRILRRLLRPEGGGVRLAREDILGMPGAALAKRIALLTQSPVAPEDLTVAELVRMGRYTHQTFFRQWSAEDARMVGRAMAATAVEPLRNRRLDTLSGGQRQRVWLAMVLAQDTPVVCLDEPINHLDLAHQLECLELVRDLNRRLGKTVILVLHDLNLAARYADHLVLLKDGRIRAQGRPADLIDEDRVRAVFGVESRVITDPVHGCPLCIPVASRPETSRARHAAE